METFFTSTGEKRELDVHETQLESKYELRKGGRLDPGSSDAKKLTVLKRVLRYTEAGYEYEAVPRQSEKLSESISLGAVCNPVVTPRLKPLLEALLKDVPVPVSGQTEFRGQAARANYFSADRVDLQKEITRFMSKSTVTSMVDSSVWGCVSQATGG